MKSWKASVCCLAIHFALFGSTAFAASEVPAGFEELVTGQKVWIDVSLLGQSAGLFEANVTLDSVQFIKPLDVLNALNLPLKKESQEYKQLADQISQPLARNGNLACGSNNNAAGCGFLTTDKLAIIYDENDSKVSVFLDKKLLPEGDKHALYYTPTRETENAFIHQQILNVVAEKDYSNVSLQGAGALGVLTNGYVGFDWSLNAYRNDDTTDQTVNVDDFYYRQSLGQRHYVQVGRMDSRDLSSNLGGNISFSMLPLGAIDGVRAGSSLSYLNRDEASKGSPVVILLSRKSRVDAYRGNQLLGTFYLNSGSNTLDTGNFPAGSYSVTLKVYEDNTLARTEVQPYTRTGGIGDGHMQWFIQGGKVANQVSGNGSTHDDTQNETAFQAGARLPVGSSTTLTAGVAKIADQHFMEGGVEWTHGFDNRFLDGVLDVQTNLLTGSDGTKGDSEQLSYNDGFSLSVYRNAAYGNECATDSDRQDYANIGCYETLNATIAVPVKAWSVSLGYTYNTNTSLTNDNYDASRSFEDNMANATQADSSSRTVQLTLNRSFLWKGLSVSTRMGAYNRTSDDDANDDKGLYLGFTLTRSTPANNTGRSSHTSVSTDYEGSKAGDDQFNYSASQDWNWGDANQRQLGVTVGGNNSTNMNADVHGHMNGQYGDASATLSDSYDRTQQTHQAALSGSYSSSMALSRSGFYWGPAGTGSPGAAVAVRVNGDENANEDNDALVNVAVDGGGSAQMSQGTKALFPVNGFEADKISVNENNDPRQTSMADITLGAGNQSVFLLPGKMKVREVKMESHYTYIGTLLTATGQPISEGKLLNAHSFIIEEDGGFTAELTQQPKDLYLENSSAIYQCPVKVESKRDVVRFVGETRCTPITPAQLPEDLRQQASSASRD
ncbi:TcfC E-set like domain-containing protein [Scandinavium goeteborgense]|uniref:TcfC E-set like domain-containing protein n=1 Tax=Scandinavium goeteborgense TaxID=1851514 RepID=UPI00381AE27A